MNNGYNGKEIDKVFQNIKRKRKEMREIDTTLPRITLPYIHGTTIKIANILKKKDIRVVFAPPNSVKNLLNKAKDLVDPRNHKGVYKIPCSCGEAYIGETRRSIETRLKEHSADLRYDRIKSSAIGEHSHNTKHHICLENSKVLAIVPNYYKRKICEATKIEKCCKTSTEMMV